MLGGGGFFAVFWLVRLRKFTIVSNGASIEQNRRLARTGMRYRSPVL